MKLANRFVAGPYRFGRSTSVQLPHRFSRASRFIQLHVFYKVKHMRPSRKPMRHREEGSLYPPSTAWVCTFA
ncbi:hypothetical protein A2524_03210 [Candidatus Wolfebacteria bacterium RIFOXYD12_FULL_48_21]|uniref:Uncharacterized protein n=1 Tax=Candidatus Wolfebacteria bacterium RIFOXYD1_FULL_48_65 TaxID=1802561 RepID=A0A1F8E3S7_9BACT|nr:MAG: hypothetical protein A2524_03210 [Candidatus Wolfebacteria bacterium RIFOXYD12_FULL_48_21]OGM95501.1 MAG: hypothetical protein A2610_03300 [Candidatus Wolfebacteria bacterium RIFOXYD1_FULL_48_65]